MLLLQISVLNLSVSRYQAPDILLQSWITPAIEMWAVGAILAELFTLSPIFPGESEVDQLYKICRVLSARHIRFFFPHLPDARFSSNNDLLLQSTAQQRNSTAWIPSEEAIAGWRNP